MVPLRFCKNGRIGICIDAPEWKNYTVKLTIEKSSNDDGIYVGVGLKNLNSDKANMLEYCVGTKNGTGLKVYKDGVESYTLGDYSSSVFAGNLRACYDEEVEGGREYTITVDFGGKDGKSITCYYQEVTTTAESYKGSSKNNDIKSIKKQGLLECKLEAYNRDVYHAVTTDEKQVYAKLVNAESFDKKVLVNLKDLEVKKKAQNICLTGARELVHVSNVNTREAELIQPTTKNVMVKEPKAGMQCIDITLPANSVTVLVLDRAM